MKLYEITGNLKVLDDLLMEGSEDVEPGELTPQLEAVLDNLEGSLTDKVEAIVKVIANKKATGIAISKEIERLQKRKKSQANAEDNLRHYLLDCLTASDIKTVTTPIATVSVRKGREKVEIVDTSLLGIGFVVIKEPQPDKVAIRKALDAGEPVPGARLVTSNNSLTIK